MSNTRIVTDTLVIGSGAAGASCALTLARQGRRVMLLSAGDTLDDGNTAYAQGGIVYRGENDSPAKLEKDILKAGWRQNNTRAVKHLARSGPDAVDQLFLGPDAIAPVFFAAKQDNTYDMTREGGHSVNRVLHCADYTGRAMMDSLVQAVQNEPNIKTLPNRTAVDLITSLHHTCQLSFRYSRVNQCLGAYVYNGASDEVETILAHYTVLAAGGLGRIYLHSTNSGCCLGSSITMAQRAGANLMNIEYVQFHPTALYHRSRRRFLITEAMRGEGAQLLNSRGERFMPRYDRQAELAPRDIVSRAIVDELHRTGEDCVYLDCRPMELDLTTRFPTIYNKCKEIGLDINSDPIPVVPAAHYHCGGVFCDLNGRTSLERLYAAGECSCTGVHGANRLASTSLLEAVLWGRNAGQAIAGALAGNKRANKRLLDSILDWVHPGQAHNEDPALIAQDWMTIRSTMWNYAGITRNEQRLVRAAEDLRMLIKNLTAFYKRTPISKPLVDLFHGSYAAYILAMSALRNKQSVGCHYMQED